MFDQSMIATRLRAFYNPFIGFLPNLGLAVVLLVGGRQVINGSLTLGDFTAFYAYLLMLIAPMLQQGVKLQLPKADNTTEKPETQDQTVLHIDAQNRFYVNALEVNPNDVVSRIQSALEDKAAATRLFANQVIPQLARGLVRPVVDQVFPLEQLAEAHRYMEADRNFGKIVLTL